jgi:hypothetical protein
MMLLGHIAAWSLLAFGALLFIVQLVAHEIGFWIGRRRAARSNLPSDGVGVLVGGVLALLAFVLALTLSFASARFDERREGTLAEANAIGTAWLRAKAIGQTSFKPITPTSVTDPTATILPPSTATKTELSGRAIHEATISGVLLANHCTSIARSCPCSAAQSSTTMRRSTWQAAGASSATASMIYMSTSLRSAT